MPDEIITRRWRINAWMVDWFSPVELKPGTDLMKQIVIMHGRTPAPTLVVSRDGRLIVGTGTEDELDSFDRLLQP